MRLTKLHSGSWEEKAVSMKKVRADYQNMQRRLNIATKRIEMMSAEVSLLCSRMVYVLVYMYIIRRANHKDRNTPNFGT